MRIITRLRNPSLLSLTIAASLFGLSPTVRADEENLAGKFYFSASLGGSWIGSTTLTSADSFLNSGRVRFTPGGRLDAGFGYHLTEWLAAELETGIAINFTDRVEDNGSSGDGLGFYQLPLLANVVFRLPTHSRFKPFIGAGVGGVLTQLDDSNLFYSHSDEDFGFAWQGFAGVRYELNSTVELGLVYKCLGTTERSFGSFSVRMEGTDTQSLSVSVSVKF